MSRSSALEITACPVCAGTDCAELAHPDAVKAEVEALWQFHTRRLDPAIPAENLTDRVAFSQRPPLRVVQCRSCGLVYRNPRERAHELTGAYAGEVPGEDVLETLFQTQLGSYRAQARRLRAMMRKRGTGIEIGSYVGGFLAAAREQNFDIEGLDINEPASAFARRKGFRVSIGDLESWTERRTVDTVAIWNCFDQLPDPRRAATAAHSLLAPGGIIAIRVPNGGFYAMLRPHLDRASSGFVAALLAHNNLLSFPYRHGFTIGALSRLLEATGFEVVRVFGDTLVPVADRWTRHWAAIEERTVKAALRAMGRVTGRWGAEHSPWIEVYARRVDQSRRGVDPWLTER